MRENTLESSASLLPLGQTAPKVIYRTFCSALFKAVAINVYLSAF